MGASECHCGGVGGRQVAAGVCWSLPAWAGPAMFSNPCGDCERSPVAFGFVADQVGWRFAAVLLAWAAVGEGRAPRLGADALGQRPSCFAHPSLVLGVGPQGLACEGVGFPAEHPGAHPHGQAGAAQAGE